MNHRIFERKWRSWAFPGARLSERRFSHPALSGGELGHEASLCESKRSLEVERSRVVRKPLVARPSRCGSDISPRERGFEQGRRLLVRERPERKQFILLDQPRPQIRRDYPLNLSISISGGKETNQDSLSNGERTGNSSNFKSRTLASANCSFQKRYPREGDRSKLLGTAYRRG